MCFLAAHSTFVLYLPCTTHYLVAVIRNTRSSRVHRMLQGKLLATAEQENNN